MYLLITYDVATPDREGQRRLRRVARTCLNYGQRVQASVFECEVTGAQAVELQTALKNIINNTSDSIRIYHLNKNENNRVTVLGQQTAYNIDAPLII